MKLQQVKTTTGERYFITFPKQIVEAYNWKKGQELKMEIGNNKTIIIKEK